MFYRNILSVAFVTVLVCAPSIVFADDHDNENNSSKRLYEDWQFSVGAGVMYSPDYEGSDDYDVGFMPNVEVVWNDQISLSIDGLLIDAVQTENLTLGFGLGIAEGRDESDNVALKGLGDIDSSVSGILYGSYEWNYLEFGATFDQDLGSGHEGATLELEANLMVPVIDDKLMIMIGPDATWASEDYMQSFFGISSTQASNSAYSKYDVGAGFKNVGLHVMAEYRFTDTVSLNAITQYSKIIGDAADSPIVKDQGSDNQLFGGVLLSYSF